MSQGAVRGAVGPPGPAGALGSALRKAYSTGAGGGQFTLNAGNDQFFFADSLVGSGRDVLVYHQFTMTIIGGGSVSLWCKVDTVHIPGRFFYAGIAGTQEYNGIVRIPGTMMRPDITHSIQSFANVNGNGHTVYNDLASGNANREFWWVLEL